MKIMVDLTDTLKDWTEFLSDLQCDLDDVRSSIRYYDPMDDSPFLDELIESEYNYITDDVIEVIQLTACTLLRRRIDSFMGQLGFSLRRIIDVFMTSLSSAIFAVVDVIQLGLTEGMEDVDASGRYHRDSSQMADIPRLVATV